MYMKLTTRQDAAEAIRRFEGLSHQPYKDTRGEWTVGYGHKILSSLPLTSVTTEEAEKFLMWDLDSAISDANIIIETNNLDEWWELPLTHMVFQLGFTGTQGFQLAIAAMAINDIPTVINELWLSLWAEQTPQRTAFVTGIISGMEVWATEYDQRPAQIEAR